MNAAAKVRVAELVETLAAELPELSYDDRFALGHIVRVFVERGRDRLRREANREAARARALQAQAEPIAAAKPAASELIGQKWQDRRRRRYARHAE